MPRNKPDAGDRTIFRAVRIDSADGDGPIFYEEGDELAFQEEVLDELSDEERQELVDHLTDKGAIAGFGGKADEEEGAETVARQKTRRVPKAPRTKGRLVGKEKDQDQGKE